MQSIRISILIICCLSLILAACADQSTSNESAVSTDIVLTEVNHSSALGENFASNDWIEIYNRGTSSVDLSGWMFQDSNEANIFELPEGTTLEGGGYLVLCRDAESFAAVYPAADSCLGDFEFGLNQTSDSGRLLDDQGDLVDEFTYDTEDSWPTVESYQTLALIDPNSDNSLPASWEASVCLGSPGQSNDTSQDPADCVYENAITINDNNGADYNPVIVSANFVSSINNPYFTLTLGSILTYQAEEEGVVKERIEMEVTSEMKSILGVLATGVREKVYEDDELVENNLEWYAQDNEGNVWTFGEEAKTIENEEITSTSGSWEAGIRGAKAGIFMKANPQVGDVFRPYFVQGEDEDIKEILVLSESISVAAGNYTNCLKIKDWSPLEPDVVEHKYFCQEIAGLALAQVVDAEEKEELIEVK